MNTKTTPTSAAVILAALLLPGTQTQVNASIDWYSNVAYQNNFSSLNDTGWTHLSAFALSTGQTWDASTGAYRLTAPAGGYNGYGFVGSVVTGLTLGNGYVQSDVVTWQGVGTYGGFGVGSRLSGLATPLGLTGYAIVYEPYGADIRLQRLGPPSIFNNLGSMSVTLTPGSQYAFTLETTGSSIVGSLWNVGQVGTSLVGSVSATDATYASGSAGVFAVNITPMPVVDVTFDNFAVMIPEPGSLSLLGLGLAGFLAVRARRTK